MNHGLKVVLAIGALALAAAAREPSDCLTRSVINNGLCIGKDGSGCSKQAQSRICYEAQPQYTDEAAAANIRGIVRLTATVRTDGCANDIKIIGSLGYGLDEAAVAALRRYRFRKPIKAISINVEFNFDPQLSPKGMLTAPMCEELAHRSPGRK